MNRRELIRLAATATTGAFVNLRLRPTPLPILPAGLRARNIIFFAYDGTGFEDLAAAHHFSRSLQNAPLHFETLVDHGRSGLLRTDSLLSVVPDSAAASTAWATGRRGVNRQLSQYPDGTPLTTILELARQGGMATGLATSTRVTHATPAAWIAHDPDRDAEERVARAYLDFGPDVVLGGGSGPFEPTERADGADLFAAFRSKGYALLRTREDLDRATGDRLLGTFTPGTEHLPFEIDRRFRGREAPALEELVRKSLEVLDGSENGFVLQVEAGRIDHANHQNDPGALVWDWLAADRALELVLRYVDRNPDTLLIAAADHDTGGGVVYGYGTAYLRSTEALSTLHRRRASHEWLLREGLRTERDPRTIARTAAEFLGIPLRPERARQVAEVLNGEDPARWRWGHPNAHGNQPANSVGHLLSITDEAGGVERPNLSFATGQHTAGFVPVVLYGAGVTPGNLGILHSVDLFGVMTQALGIVHENPAMEPSTAREWMGEV